MVSRVKIAKKPILSKKVSGENNQLRRQWTEPNGQLLPLEKKDKVYVALVNTLIQAAYFLFLKHGFRSSFVSFVDELQLSLKDVAKSYPSKKTNQVTH